MPDRRGLESSLRIVRIAVDGVFEPSAVALLAASTSAVLAIGAFEGAMLCNELHGPFIFRYAVEQLLPSCVWSTQDATIVATAMGLDPQTVLQNLEPSVPSDAQTILRTQLLAAARSMAAGFMLLAQLVRVGTIGADAPTVYKERIRKGQEPPMLSSPLIVRLCGRESDVTTTSLRRMGRHLLPVYEDPDRVSHLAWGKRYPVYWCVRPGRYGYSYWWRDFPVDECCFLDSSTGRKVLLLEADATNADDPLALGDHALDLTIDDAAQGFRRIEELYRRKEGMPKFGVLRVFLGYSLELSKSGGGHAYTLRHRVRFAKEVDVLIDSRAPVLKEILRWCDRVADKDRRILFQTSSRQYFLNLRLLMKKYGYKIYDPLDWRMLDELEEAEATEGEVKTNTEDTYESLLQVLVDEQYMDYASQGVISGNDEKTEAKSRDKAMRQRLRQIIKLSRLPRIVYYGNTAETVNAVQALVNAGEVEVANCCAILDKEEGMSFLTMVLDEQSDDLVHHEQSTNPIKKGERARTTPKSGLHIVCSSTIYDDLFRQVRHWTRKGYTAKQIQTELDIRFEDILQETREVKETIAEEVLIEEETVDKEAVPDAESSGGETIVSSSEDGLLDTERKP